MQTIGIDPITGLAVGLAISLLLSMYDTYVLYRKGAVGKHDVILLLKIVSALLPQVKNPVVQQLMNETLHAIMDRLGLPGKSEDVDKLLEKIEKMSQPGVQFGVQSPQPQGA